MALDQAVRKVRAIWDLAFSKGAESEVPKSWLFRNARKMDEQFAAEKNYTISKDGQYLRFQVGNELFLWPANLPVRTMLVMLSELLTPPHPHHYIWGQTQIGADDVLLDIGACEGAFVAMMSPRCKGAIVVEPSRTMCKLIEDLFKLRQQPCPVIQQCLMGERTSTAYFAEDLTNPGASKILDGPAPGAYEVPVKTLDQLVDEVGIVPTFIKCDAEGAAAMIFSGGRNFLARHKPKLAIASYHTDTEYQQLHDMLKPLGYTVRGKGFLYGGNKLRVQMLHAW